MHFSIIIPTYNRAEKLLECLKALFVQEYSKNGYEIIVVDDGSQDDTEKILCNLQKESPVSLRFLFQSNQGQGVARNRGVSEARGDIILFLGDDIMATPSLLKEHARMHQWYPEENAAVLGFITWHPKLLITPLMRFMERGGAILGKWGGHQFAYDLLRGKKIADYNFFYTSNISLKRTLLLRFRFDPWFSGYGWEDIELGYRLTKGAGLVLSYEPSAIAYHDHMITFEQFASRMRAIGRSSHLIHTKYPELQKIPSPQKQKIFRFLSHSLVLAIAKMFSKDLYFYSLSKKYFLEGMKEGIMQKNVKII